MLQALLTAALMTSANPSHALAARGETEWPHWRGPNYDGSALASDLPGAAQRRGRA